MSVESERPAKRRKIHDSSAEPEVSQLPYKEYNRRNTIPGISRDFLRPLLVVSRCVCVRR